MSLQSEVASVSLDDLSSLSLTTRDGYFVHLGANSSLHAKLRAMTMVLQDLRTTNTYAAGGTVDVSNQAYPTYDPPGSSS